MPRPPHVQDPLSSVWETPPEHLDFPRTSAHLWLAEFDGGAEEHYAALLDEDEKKRAARFHFAEDRVRFMGGRFLLRGLLGYYLQMPPKTLRFQYEKHGKPSLREAPRTLHFNLSHSGAFLLAAFSGAGRVGVDIEHKRGLEVEKLAGRYFSPREEKNLLDTPRTERINYFYRLWTAKEAFLKATGEGLAGLESVEVSLEPPALHARNEKFPSRSTWHLHPLEMDTNYCAALVMENTDAAPRCFSRAVLTDLAKP